jgi:UDP-GlcNAc:undecaprenyl-phosphate/decaprenyl-phosphate GlcNAc-1-phosphate transferase
MIDAASTNTDTVMTVLQPYMPVFYVSFVVTMTLTPLMRFLAQRHGIVDDPDGKRKVHTQPIAYLGGVATFLGWLAGVCISVTLRPHGDIAAMTTHVQVPPGIILGAAVVVLFGLMDDVYSLAPRVKLFGQFLAACCLVIPGTLGIGTDFFLGSGGVDHPNGVAWMFLLALQRYEYVNYYHMNPTTLSLIQQGAMFTSGVIAIFIIISTCNATNLLDGLDGLCSGVTGIMSVGYLILAAYLATQAAIPENAGLAVDPTRITLSLALLGAVLGFLPFNFNPASIFMGDTGSMFLGYMCGTMMLLFGQDGIVRWFLAAVVIFGLPLLDTFLAIVRRKLNGKPIFSPDANHFHHFLIRRGFTVRKAVLLSYGLTAIFVSFALVIVIIQTQLAIGLYLVLFCWLVVAAFKMGMIFQSRPPGNSGLNASVIGPTTTTATPAETIVPPAKRELQPMAPR